MYRQVITQSLTLQRTSATNKLQPLEPQMSYHLAGQALSSLLTGKEEGSGSIQLT